MYIEFLISIMYYPKFAYLLMKKNFPFSCWLIAVFVLLTSCSQSDSLFIKEDYAQVSDFSYIGVIHNDMMDNLMDNFIVEDTIFNNALWMNSLRM